MPRHVILLSLDWIREKDPRTSLGHASILAKLRTVPDLSVTSLVFAVNHPGFDRTDVLNALFAAAANHAESDIAIGAYIWNEATVQWLLPRLRAGGFQGRIILGGPQISYAPAGVDALYPDADLFIRGYAEDSMATLLAGDIHRRIGGVSGRGSDTSSDSGLIELASLPSPYLSGALPITPFVRWETQRGCVFACSFCQHRESGARLRQNLLSSHRVADEVDLFCRAGVADIAVLDPIFHSNPEGPAILRRFAANQYRGQISLQCRFEMVDADFLDACAGLNVRLEFGLQTVQRAEMLAIGRMNDLGKSGAAIAELHRRGIDFEVTLMYGLPNQTLASFRESLRWCADRGVPVLKAWPLMLLRGTKLERERDRWGLVENDDEIPVVVRSNSFTEEEWRAMGELARGD